MRRLHRCPIPIPKTGILQKFRKVIPMQIRERLQYLRTLPVPMHIAKAANIHQNVEAQPLPCRELAQQLIMPPAMPQPQVDNLIPPRLRQRSNMVPNLPEGIMASPIKQRRRNLHLQRFPTLHQIHHRRIL